VRLELAQRRDDAIEALPVARRTPDPAVYHQLGWLFSHFGIEVIHEHAQRCFREPAFGGDLRTAGRLDGAGVVDDQHEQFLVVQRPVRAPLIVGSMSSAMAAMTPERISRPATTRSG